MYTLNFSLMLVAYNRTQKDMLKQSVNKNNNCKAQINASTAKTYKENSIALLSTEALAFVYFF